MLRRYLTSSSAALLLALAAGCGQNTPSAPTASINATDRERSGSEVGRDNSAAATHAGTAHTHVAPHGGQIQAVGDVHFELAYESGQGKFTLYTLGSQETQAQPIDASEILLQVKDEKTGALHQLNLAADPQPGDTHAKPSRFSGVREELRALDRFVAVVRVPVEGEMHRASFQFLGGKPIGGVPPIQYACSMKCEPGKTYDQPAKCPVCGMTLVEFKSGLFAHADHSPKHDGVFFMAPDNWHHLEGTLPNPRELRVYLYDNFTQPMAATAFAGELKVTPVDDQDDPRGETVSVALEPAPDAKYLVARLPDRFQPPYQTEARIQFPKQPQKYVFNFDFKRLQHKD